MIRIFAMSIFSYVFIIAVAILSPGCKVEEIDQVTTSPCSAMISIANDHPKTIKLNSLVEKTIEQGLVGLSLVVQSPSGYYEKHSGYANLEHLIPMGHCHTMRVASLTKTVLATGIMLLVESGQLKLEGKMNTYLSKAVLDKIPGADSVTIRELLNHTSGIPNYDDDSRYAALILNKPGSHISLEKKLDLVRDDNRIPKWVIEKFGYIYSNTNYLLLQLILEKVSGQSFSGFVTERIFNPINVREVRFGKAGFYPHDLATGYVDFYGNNTLRNVHQWDAGRFDAEGNLIMKASEVFLFFTNLLQANIVSEETLNLMASQRLGLLSNTFGGKEAFGHDGIAIGYSSEMWFLPDQNLTIVLLSNQGRLIEDTDQVLLFENLLEAIIGEVCP